LLGGQINILCFHPT